MYFSSLVEPSNRVVGDVYGPTLSLVTNFRPVSVAGGETRPPDNWNRYMYSVGRKPCRYGDWSTVKATCPAAIAVRVCGSRSKPPAATLPTRLYLASELPSRAVSPPSTAKMPWMEEPCASTKEGTAVASCEAEAPASKPDVPNMTFIPADCRAAAAPSRRGWMFSAPGCAMRPTAVSPFFISDASREPTSCPEAYRSCPTYARPLVGLETEPVALYVTTGIPADSALAIGWTNEVASTTVVAMPGELAETAAWKEVSIVETVGWVDRAPVQAGVGRPRSAAQSAKPY